MDKNYRSNFGMMIPQGPYREPKKSDTRKWLCRLIGHKWEIYMITTRDKGMPHRCKRCHKVTSIQWPFKLNRFLWNWADWILRPLCFSGWHRWKGTYRVESISYGSSERERHEEQHYRCSRCRKSKTIQIS